jgi:hypothetical protein
MPPAGPNPPDLRPNNQMTAEYPSVPSRGEGADAVARSGGGTNGGTGDGDGGSCVTSGSYALGNGMLNLSWGLQSVRPRRHALVRNPNHQCSFSKKHGTTHLPARPHLGAHQLTPSPRALPLPLYSFRRS